MFSITKILSKNSSKISVANQQPIVGLPSLYSDGPCLCAYLIMLPHD